MLFLHAQKIVYPWENSRKKSNKYLFSGNVHWFFFYIFYAFRATHIQNRPIILYYYNPICSWQMWDVITACIYLPIWIEKKNSHLHYIYFSHFWFIIFKSLQNIDLENSFHSFKTNQEKDNRQIYRHSIEDRCIGACPIFFTQTYASSEMCSSLLASDLSTTIGFIAGVK